MNFVFNLQIKIKKSPPDCITSNQRSVLDQYKTRNDYWEPLIPRTNKLYWTADSFNIFQIHCIVWLWCWYPGQSEYINISEEEKHTFPPNRDASYNLSEQRLYTLYFPWTEIMIISAKWDSKTKSMCQP